MIRKIIIIFLCFIVMHSFVQSSYGEEIWITRSENMNEVVFDGKWTSYLEWKPTSFDRLKNSDVVIRSAHQDNFIYFLIDVIEDKTFDRKSDRAIICFDTENEKSKMADTNDYCFIGTLGSKEGMMLQGGTPFPMKSNLKKIDNHPEFIAVGNQSDENDRYSRIPHVSYEFKIPTDVVGKNDNYGLLIYVYDSYQNKIITWPESIKADALRIPSPSSWGSIISPDKSLPEFNLTLMILSVTIFLTIILTKTQKLKINYF